MKIDYLNSIIDLYLKNDYNYKKTCLAIKKNPQELEFCFSMKNNKNDKTKFSISNLDISNNFSSFLNRYKQDLLIIDEKYDYNRNNNTCYYYVLFKNGRTLSLNGFTIVEINSIRNILHNIQIRQEEIRIDVHEEEKKDVYQPKLSFGYAGYASFSFIFLVSISIFSVLMVSLLIFTIAMK